MMTFKAPFLLEGNGFIANWLALVTSMIMTVELMPTVKGHLEKLARCGAVVVPALILASIVVFVNTAIGCSATDDFPFAGCPRE